MSLLSYLHKRPNSQNWQLRMMVPEAVRPIIGKREFTRSLRTPDKRRAEELAWSILAGWKAELAACATEDAATSANGARTPSRAELDEAALLVGYEEASLRLPKLISAKAKLGAVAFVNLTDEFNRRHGEAVRNLFAGDNRYWRERAKIQVARRGWALPEDSELFEEFVKTLAQCGTDLFARAKAAVEGAGDAFVPGDAVIALSKARDERAAPNETIIDLYDRYAAQRLSEGKKRKDTLAQDRKVVEHFAAFVGEHRNLRSIKAADIREWRNANAALPAAYRKRKAYLGMTMEQAAAHAKLIGVKGLSLVTVNKSLSAVSALFSWAKREGYADANPCDDLFYDADRGKNARPPFSVEQLNSILVSPLFTGFAEDGKEHVRGQRVMRDWRFWVPLICLFTGARIGEIAQLRVLDFQEQDGHHFFLIRHEEKAGQTTKSGASRPAPIHSKLRAVGLLDFVAARKEQAAATGDDRLFPDLELDARGQHGRASRFWRTYLERIGIKATGTGGDGLGAHSFRHGLADQLRLAGYFDRDIEVVLGHNQSTVTSGYGKLRQGTVSRLSEMIENAIFHDVNFNHLITTSEAMVEY